MYSRVSAMMDSMSEGDVAPYFTRARVDLLSVYRQANNNTLFLIPVPEEPPQPSVGSATQGKHHWCMVVKFQALNKDLIVMHSMWLLIRKRREVTFFHYSLGDTEL